MSCLVRVTFKKCDTIDSPNAPMDAPCHEFYRFNIIGLGQWSHAQDYPFIVQKKKNLYYHSSNLVALHPLSYSLKKKKLKILFHISLHIPIFLGPINQRTKNEYSSLSLSAQVPLTKPHKKISFKKTIRVTNWIKHRTRLLIFVQPKFALSPIQN